VDADAGRCDRRSVGVEPLDLAMAAHIRMALAVGRGRIEGETGAAKLLGINPHKGSSGAVPAEPGVGASHRLTP